MSSIIDEAIKVCRAADQLHIVDLLESKSSIAESDKITLAKHVCDVRVDLAVQAFYETTDEKHSMSLKHSESLSHLSFRPPSLSHALDSVKSVGVDETVSLPKEEASPLFKLKNMVPEVVASLTYCGYKFISENKLACLLLAGGQGTRLGFNGPKGCYNVGLPSKKTLFQLFAERIQRMEYLAAAAMSKDASSVVIPFLVMCSTHNYEDTVKHFQSHGFFGLKPENVIFFRQTVIPCFTDDGKILLSSPTQVATNPNGNGGVFESLRRTGVLKQLQDRGVLSLHVFGVDNILAKCADPLFVGLCVACGVSAGNKCCEKLLPGENLGVMCEKIGKTNNLYPFVVEYSELSQADKEARVNPEDPKSDLLFSCGNICNHYFTVNFIDNLLRDTDFKYHVARKKVPYYDVQKKTIVTPTAPNGIKLEYFIFDAFPVAKQVLALEGFRNLEFSAVKNLTGAESPASALADYDSMCRRWAVAAGLNVQGDGVFEISPRVSYAGEGLESMKGQTFTTPTTVESSD